EQEKRNRDTATVLIYEPINAAFAVGTPGANEGIIYLFFGQDNFPATVSAADADVDILGEPGESNFGKFVNGLGDINGDEFEDFGAGGDEFMDVIY
ncbi:MAG: hypothetical protein AAF462_09740, partial [Thermodesulfobacteriota bacterium]